MGWVSKEQKRKEFPLYTTKRQLRRPQTLRAAVRMNRQRQQKAFIPRRTGETVFRTDFIKPSREGWDGDCGDGHRRKLTSEAAAQGRRQEAVGRLAGWLTPRNGRYKWLELERTPVTVTGPRPTPKGSKVEAGEGRLPETGRLVRDVWERMRYRSSAGVEAWRNDL